MSNFELFAEIMHKEYIAALERELSAVLENIEEAQA